VLFTPETLEVFFGACFFIIRIRIRAQALDKVFKKSFWSVLQ